MGVCFFGSFLQKFLITFGDWYDHFINLDILSSFRFFSNFFRFFCFFFKIFHFHLKFLISFRIFRLEFFLFFYFGGFFVIINLNFWRIKIFTYDFDVIGILRFFDKTPRFLSFFLVISKFTASFMLRRWSSSFGFYQL